MTMRPDQSPEQAASYLESSQQTLRRWRKLGVGPAYVRMPGGRVRYRTSDLDAYLESATVLPLARPLTRSTTNLESAA